MGDKSTTSPAPVFKLGRPRQVLKFKVQRPKKSQDAKDDITSNGARPNTLSSRDMQPLNDVQVRQHSPPKAKAAKRMRLYAPVAPRLSFPISTRNKSTMIVRNSSSALPQSPVNDSAKLESMTKELNTFCEATEDELKHISSLENECRTILEQNTAQVHTLSEKTQNLKNGVTALQWSQLVLSHLTEEMIQEETTTMINKLLKMQWM